ncbi:hypothetical protein [Paraburkholderia acidisoli]|uniref:Uncharacterized protein n=1 Tax=Paraburkholderia acidisoli TaxID=2571748 RepID=A0A7Z2JKB0_9BURK|nr:hypothetical protein [Paraburkholderia acidisoli]QGZ66260.1 hypothetical protein FAZ98_31145 [Paraburkholderia acidisoli]QGZ66348.1 hypothetical protein FAZ98_31640 [Paraburkholderia acidisoli]
MIYTLIFNPKTDLVEAVGSYSSEPELSSNELVCTFEQWKSPALWKLSNGQIVAA